MLKIHRELLAALREEIPNHQFDVVSDGGRHMKLSIVKPDGGTVKWAIPGTPSDYRSRINFVKQIKKRLSES
jgi:hypothetical protein